MINNSKTEVSLKNLLENKKKWLCEQASLKNQDLNRTLSPLDLEQ